MNIKRKYLTIFWITLLIQGVVAYPLFNYIVDRMTIRFGEKRILLLYLFLTLLLSLVSTFIQMLFWIGRTRESVLKPIRQLSAHLSLMTKSESNLFIEYPYMDDLKPLIDYVNTTGATLSRKLRDSAVEKRKLDYIFSNIDSGLLLVNSHGEIAQMNAKVEDFLQFPAHSVGQSLQQVCHSPQIIHATEKAITHGTSSFFNLSLQEGKLYVAVQINTLDLRWAEEGHYAVAVITDITEMKRLEQLRSEFVANASHELKTPITSIRGFAELISEGIVTDPNVVLDYLGRIRKESDTMTHIIEDILRLAQLEDAAVPQINQVLCLECICQDVIQSMASLAMENHIDITLVGKLKGYGCKEDMRQLFENLISNAIRYNQPNGSVRVSLKDRGNHGVIVVEDTGIGIPKEAQDRIFERFYRVDKGRSRSSGGTGLGLSIVKHIVSKYDGSLSLSSELQVGTTITIAFPASFFSHEHS